jgi:hypothetical protein
MLRIRCEVARNAATLRLTYEVATARRWSHAGFRPIGPYGLTVPLVSSNGASTTAVGGASAVSSSFMVMNRCWRQHAGETLYFAPGSSLAGSRRFARVAGKKDNAEQAAGQEGNVKPEGEQQQQQQQQQAEGQSADGSGDAKPAPEPEAPKPNIFSQIRSDFTKYPDIYNAINLLNFVLFTTFCLCSTGSNVETEWWMEHWGIDAAFRPWAWALHSLLTNNFLSMAFAMMMIHGMCTSAVTSVGATGLMQYLAIVSVVSGVLMWAFNSARGYRAEKQFGPWDITAALFVMQFLHQGFKPWQILNSFSGWQKYAMWVGAFCIMYYDYQPVVCGTVLGFLLVKGVPKFKAPAVAAA